MFSLCYGAFFYPLLEAGEENINCVLMHVIITVLYLLSCQDLARSLSGLEGDRVIFKPEREATESAVIASLYIQAVRQGQSTWFRVISGSMRPLIHSGDAVYIEPATAAGIEVGDIAAFETPAGLLIHRIVHRQQAGAYIRFIEMGDAALQANWMKEQAIVGRVILACRGNRQLDLRRPIAKRCGKVTAHLRYQLYCLCNDRKLGLVCVALRKCASQVARVGYLCIRASCASAVDDPTPPSVEM